MNLRTVSSASWAAGGLAVRPISKCSTASLHPRAPSPLITMSASSAAGGPAVRSGFRRKSVSQLQRRPPALAAPIATTMRGPSQRTLHGETSHEDASLRSRPSTAPRAASVALPQGCCSRTDHVHQMMRSLPRLNSFPCAGPVLRQPPSVVHELIHVGAVSHLLFAQAILPLMRESPDSGYVIVSGGAGAVSTRKFPSLPELALSHPVLIKELKVLGADIAAQCRRFSL